jgi:signal transduction histidine kinase
MLRALYRFLHGTLRGRLILGVAVVHAVMMTLFIVDLTARQRTMLLDHQIDEGTALSQSLATSAAGWILSNDISGLQELVEIQRRYPEIIFAILADQQGRVLADTDKSKLGQYMLDLPHEARQTMFLSTPALVDVAVPAMIGGQHVGWARIGIGQRAAEEKLTEIVRTGVLYALAAIVIGSLIAWFMGHRITKRLYAVQDTIDAVRSGDSLARSPVTGIDEAAVMAHEFNSMLDELAERDSELRKSRDELEGKVIERTADLQTANTSLLEEKRHQEELIRKLAEAHNQLLQSEKMASVGQLAAGVAHEINNPVGFVNSNLGTLKHYIADLLKALSLYEENEGELTEETRVVLTELKRQIDIVYLREDIGKLLSESIDGMQRVKRIVQDLKDFSHVGETEMLLADLEQGLDSTLNVVWNELKYKADVVKEYGGIPNILCMPAQLNQVFMNLLTNAGQAIDNHGRITIRTGQEGDNVWVEVEDTGKGIKPENLERIFDPFFTTKPVGSGTGLGLSLSYGIVKKHGGRIEVKSEVGKGSVFRVVLPQHAVPA